MFLSDVVDTLNWKSVRSDMFNKVLFIGSKASGLKVLKEIYYASPERLIGCVTVDDSNDTRSELRNFLEFCAYEKIRLDVLTGNCDITASLSKFAPDLCIVMGWYYIIPNHLLTKVKGGFIGVHNSLLPAYRGFAPVVWAIISGENKTGFSVFSFEKGMDSGDIWFQDEVEIKKDDYISDVLKKLDDKIYVFFEKHYLDILENKIKPRKQLITGVSYGAQRRVEDGKIDWTMSAYDIYNFIRAQSKPYPGAYFIYKENKVILWKAEVFPYKIYGTPGQIGLINSEDKEVIVVCGNKTGLRIKTVEVNHIDKPATEVIRSLKYRVN